MCPGIGLGPREQLTSGSSRGLPHAATPAGGLTAQSPSRENARRRDRHGVPEATGLLRPRLLRRLDDLLDVRLGVIVAPAGAGKTTLMAQWARQAPVDVAWYAAEPADAGVPALIARLSRALAPARPPARDVSDLVDAVDGRDSPLVLVVDDLHHVCTPEVVDVLQSLLLRTRPRFRLLAGSRRTSGFNLARTELPSMSVPPDELRLRARETVRLFHDVYDVPLSQVECDQLTRHTEGWAAGLALFHHSLAGRPVRDSATRHLDGWARYARDYLDREVLADLPAELVDFLRETSVLESLSAHRCDALLGSRTSWRALLDLERRTTLVTASGATTFHVHAVLRRHLLTELRDQCGDDAVTSHHRQAAALLLAEGAPTEAAGACAAAADWAGLATLLETHGPAVVADRRTGWLTGLPATVVAQDPWLQLATATRSMREGSLGRAATEATRAATAMTEPAGSVLCSEVARFARVWTSQEDAATGSWTDRLRAAVRRPRPPRPPERPDSPEAALVHAVHRLLAGDVLHARDDLTRWWSGADHPEVSASARLLAAALSPSDAECDSVADWAEERGLPWFARIARALAMAPAYVAAGGVPAADPLAREIVEAELRGDPWTAALVTGIRGIALLRAGAPDAAGLEDLVLRFRELDAPALEAWSRACLALATAALDLPDSIRDAESAEGFARCCGIPGALAVAYAARALGAEDHRELLALAEAEARAAGLDLRPWLWVSGPAEGRSLTWPTAPRVERLTERSPRLTIRCFGGFSLTVGGEPAALQAVRPRAREVLRLLALHSGRTVHREQLVDALWRSLDAEAGTHNLHVAVSSLRAALEPGVRRGHSTLIVRDSTGYRLDLPSGSRSDVRDFDAALQEAEEAHARGEIARAVHALERASVLYTGDVLPEDGPAEWVIGLRDHYKVRAAEASGQLAGLHLAHDAPERAAAAALRSIDVDPCRDASWRMLIAAYGATGDIAAAERARRSYADVLTSLGVVADTASAVLPGR